VAKSEIGKARAVQPPIGADNLRTETLDDCGKNWLTRLHERAAQGIGFDDLGAERAQHGGDGRFTAAQAARESDS
jgi:hypothetical protein